MQCWRFWPHTRRRQDKAYERHCGKINHDDDPLCHSSSAAPGSGWMSPQLSAASVEDRGEEVSARFGSEVPAAMTTGHPCVAAMRMNAVLTWRQCWQWWQISCKLCRTFITPCLLLKLHNIGAAKSEADTESNTRLDVHHVVESAAGGCWPIQTTEACWDVVCVWPCNVERWHHTGHFLY